MIPSYFIYLLFSIIGVIITFTIGHLIPSYGKELPHYKQLFNKLFNGNLFIIIITAIIFTKFTTIITLTIIMLIYYHIIQKEKLIFKLKSNYKDYLLLISSTIIIYNIVYFIQYNPFENSMIINSDYNFYARLISFLDNYGIETPFINSYYIENRYSTPYHYGDLWHVLFFSKNFNIAPIISLFLISGTILFTNIYLGALSIIETIVKKIKIHHLMLAFLIFITSGISFYIPKDLFFTRGDWYSINFVHMGKITLILLFFIKIFLEIQYFKCIYKYVFIIAILYNITMPALFIFLGLFSIYLLILKRIKLPKILILFIAPLVIFLLYYSIFYNSFLFHTSTHNTEAFNLNLYIKTFINVFGSVSIKVFISLFIFIIGYVFVIRKKIINDYYLHLIIIANASSILAYSILNQMFDSVQFWMLIFINLNTLIVFTLVVKLLLVKLKYWYISILFILIVFIQFYSKIEHKSKLNNDLNIIVRNTSIPINNNIVFFKDSSDYNIAFDINVDVFPPLDNLIYFYSNYSPVCLSTDNIPIPTEKHLMNYYKKLKHNWVFHKYKTLHNDKTILENQISFIKENNIKYIYTSKNFKLNPSIKTLTNSFILLSDSSSFYSIK